MNYRDAVAYMSQGKAYYMQNNLEKAMVSYRDAIKPHPITMNTQMVYLQILDEYMTRKKIIMQNRFSQTNLY